MDANHFIQADIDGDQFAVHAAGDERGCLVYVEDSPRGAMLTIDQVQKLIDWLSFQLARSGHVIERQSDLSEALRAVAAAEAPAWRASLNIAAAEIESLARFANPETKR